MKFWIGVFLIAVITLSVLKCQLSPAILGEEGTSACQDVWLKNMITSLKQNAHLNSEIIQYRYNNQWVYYVDSCKGCADALAVVYTCSGDVLCQFGGIAGLYTCPDFFENATSRKVIWKN
jgi:hypothetical protein